MEERGLRESRGTWKDTTLAVPLANVTLSLGLFIPAQLSGNQTRCICGLGGLWSAGAGSGGRMQALGCLCLLAPARALIGL